MDKKAREGIETPDECLERVKEAIVRAKEDKLRAVRTRRKALMRMVAVSFVCFLVILPNMSAGVAQAMSSLPVVGEFFRVITIRDYHYMDDRFRAEVNIPEIESDSEAAKSINGKVNAIAEEWV